MGASFPQLLRLGGWAAAPNAGCGKLANSIYSRVSVDLFCYYRCWQNRESGLRTAVGGFRCRAAGGRIGWPGGGRRAQRFTERRLRTVRPRG